MTSNAADSMHIINHSDACILFVSDSIFSALDFDAIPEIRGGGVARHAHRNSGALA